MPEDVQLQVFKRSFTTKGKGRGLGTYGVKLLNERCLKGEVGFESSKGRGTTFFARYPTKI
jgi:sensor histidine kinase regulating citrate/malate metabolism